MNDMNEYCNELKKACDMEYTANLHFILSLNYKIKFDLLRMINKFHKVQFCTDKKLGIEFKTCEPKIEDGESDLDEMLIDIDRQYRILNMHRYKWFRVLDYHDRDHLEPEQKKLKTKKHLRCRNEKLEYYFEKFIKFHYLEKK